ncbi:MAG: branched-chain-amino-acid transaminase [Phycisphaerales bacterium]|nr:branched-chain-amino-acid transaminase [Phycisphaerales bacterium]
MSDPSDASTACESESKPLSNASSAPNTGQIWLDGRLVPPGEATISVFDHGLLYGDGCFEGIRVYNNRIFKLKSHLERMYRSAEAIYLTPRWSIEEIDDAIRMTVAANDLTDGYVRLVFTRGVGTLGLNPFLCKDHTAFVIAADIALYPDELYQNGLPVVVANRRRVPVECLNPEIKSLNYLNNILAKVEAIKAGVLEAIMLNERGEVGECTGDNIFMIKDGVISTPDTSAGMLHGVTRKFVIEEVAPALGHTVVERPHGINEFFEADEVFLTGTAAEVIGVNRIDSTTIGNGAVGPITSSLTAKFREIVQENAPED